MKECGIYSITNRINGKQYFGSTCDWYCRRKAHLSYLRRGIHHSRYLQRAWNKHSEDAFELSIELHVHQPFLRWVEQIYIDSNDEGYNEAKRANNPMIGRKHTAESRLKMSLSQKGKKHPWGAAAISKVNAARICTGRGYFKCRRGGYEVRIREVPKYLGTKSYYVPDEEFAIALVATLRELAEEFKCDTH